jgi:predicted DsbA family dithiol-disulfide isomerase
MSTTEPFQIDIISDVVCPWCFIGKRRLEKALAESPVPLSIRWRPFQLDPTIPPEGKDRRAYLVGKFGSDDRIKQIYDRIAAAGAEEGIPFAFERIKVSPNTVDAHRLIRWADEGDQQDRLVDALFRAYFLEGRDIGDHAVLTDTAAAVGMDREEVARRLATDEDRTAVQLEIASAQQMGVTGVPTFIMLGRYALVGAQPAEEILRAIEAVSERQLEAANA